MEWKFDSGELKGTPGLNLLPFGIFLTCPLNCSFLPLI